MRRVARFIAGWAPRASGGRRRERDTGAGDDALSDLRVEIAPSLDAVRDDWERLALAGGNPFGSWDWAVSWWRAFGAGRELMLRVVRRPHGEVAAVLPLYLAARRGPVRIARFVGHGPGDQLGPVCAPQDRHAAACALRQVAFDELGGGGLLLAERLVGDEGWAGMLGGRPLRWESSPRVAIEGRTWDDWLASKSRNFREQVRRRERKLKREHDVSIRLAEGTDAILSGFATLIELHDARWAGESRAFTAQRLALHMDFLRRAADRGWVRLWLCELDGRPAAAWYGLRFGDADWYYQAGRAPEFARENVGFVLLCHTIRDAFSAGRRDYRFLLGDEPYKTRFMTDDPGLRTVALSAGPAALAAQAAANVGQRLPAGARRRLLRGIG